VADRISRLCRHKCRITRLRLDDCATPVFGDRSVPEELLDPIVEWLTPIRHSPLDPLDAHGGERARCECAQHTRPSRDIAFTFGVVEQDERRADDEKGSGQGSAAAIRYRSNSPTPIDVDVDQGERRKGRGSSLGASVLAGGELSSSTCGSGCDESDRDGDPLPERSSSNRNKCSRQAHNQIDHHDDDARLISNRTKRPDRDDERNRDKSCLTRTNAENKSAGVARAEPVRPLIVHFHG
jgi:hypothetical protein